MIHAIDSHCHLDYDELAGDIPGVLSRAQSAVADLRRLLEQG